MVYGESETGAAAVDVKARRPWAVAVLSVFTLGIYWLVWYYKVNREMRDYGSAHDDRALARSRPWRSVLAVSVGGSLVIPELVSLVHFVRRVQAVERIAGGGPRPGSLLIALLVGPGLVTVGMVVYGAPAAVVLLLCIPSVVAIALVQARLNATWERTAALTPDPLAQPAH